MSFSKCLKPAILHNSLVVTVSVTSFSSVFANITICGCFAVAAPFQNIREVQTVKKSTIFTKLYEYKLRKINKIRLLNIVFPCVHQNGVS